MLCFKCDAKKAIFYRGRSASTRIAKPKVHVEDVILLVKKAITNKINAKNDSVYALAA